MTSRMAALVSHLLTVLVNSRWPARLVRAAMVTVAAVLGLVLFVGAPTSGACQLLAGLQVVLVLALCRWPGSMLLALLPLPAVAWCLAAHAGWPKAALLAGLVWLVRRLCVVASMAPSHARVANAAIVRVTRDAVVELALLVAAGALVTAGWFLAPSLPSGPWWAAGLVAAVVGSIAAADGGRHV